MDISLLEKKFQTSKQLKLNSIYFLIPSSCTSSLIRWCSHPKWTMPILGIGGRTLKWPTVGRIVYPMITHVKWVMIQDTPMWDPTLGWRLQKFLIGTVIKFYLKKVWRGKIEICLTTYLFADKDERTLQNGNICMKIFFKNKMVPVFCCLINY